MATSLSYCYSDSQHMTPVSFKFLVFVPSAITFLMPTRTLKRVLRDDLVSYDLIYISLLSVPISCVLYVRSKPGKKALDL